MPCDSRQLAALRFTPFRSATVDSFCGRSGEQAPAETQLTPKASPCARPGLAVRFGAPRERTRHQRAIARLQADETQTDTARSHYYGVGSSEAGARAAFLATRLTPAPVFRTALFADFIAFAVLDFLRFAIFVPLDS